VDAITVVDRGHETRVASVQASKELCLTVANWQPVGVISAPRVLVTGRPGAGKTTVVGMVVDRLRAGGLVMRGFVTREVREVGRRTGFEVMALDGPTAVIARVGWATGVRVGRYGVDVGAFEGVALAAVRRALDGGGVVVLDELGLMELASGRFVELVGEVFAAPVAVLATVHQRAHPVTDAIKARADVEVVTVTAENRDGLPEVLSERFIWWRRSSGRG
jgi:nucleoside-triphosphatase